MNKKLLFLVLFTAVFLNIFQNTYAIRAIKNPITVTQPDGSTVTILLHGDEFRNSRTTIDGYLVKKNSKGFFTYVNTDPQAASTETNIIARDITKRTANDVNFLKTIYYFFDFSEGKTIINFDEEMKNGFTPEQFKAEMHKRIKAYPWKK